MTAFRFLARWRTLATGLMPAVLVVAAWLAPGPRPQLAFLIAGTVVVAAGEAVRIWSAGHRPGREGLITTGPYAHTRNPLYVGSFIMGIGFCLLSQLWWSWLLLAGVLAAFYLPTVGREEQHLARHHGEPYRRYLAQVPRFAPRLSAYRSPNDAGGAFSWRSVWGREEHETALWTALPVVLFWLRLLVSRGPGGGS